MAESVTRAPHPAQNPPFGSAGLTHAYRTQQFSDERQPFPPEPEPAAALPRPMVIPGVMKLATESVAQELPRNQRCPICPAEGCSFGRCREATKAGGNDRCHITRQPQVTRNPRLRPIYRNSYQYAVLRRVAHMKSPAIADVLGRGVYGASEALRLINFRRQFEASTARSISRQTIARWLRGYDYTRNGETRHSKPLWLPDYVNEDETLELSFRDLIELRFVKTFKDYGLTLPTIRECFMRAVEAVHDDRPFSTRKFRTDGKTIFLEITHDVREGELLDLRRRQQAFHNIVEPSLRDMEFEADIVARWFPLGASRRTIVIDPARAFGRPIVVEGGVPIEVLADAVEVEGSLQRVAKLYDAPLAAVRDAVLFHQRLAA